MARAATGRGDGAVFFSESKGCGSAAHRGRPAQRQPKYEEVTAQTQGECLAKKRKAEEEAKAGRLTDAKPMTVGRTSTTGAKNVAKPSVHESTWNSYERACGSTSSRARRGEVGAARPGPRRAVLRRPDEGRLLRGQREESERGLQLRAGARRPRRSGPRQSGGTGRQAEARRYRDFPRSPPTRSGRSRKAVAGHRLRPCSPWPSAPAREGELLGSGTRHIDLEAGTITIRRSLAPVKGGFVLRSEEQAASAWSNCRGSASMPCTHLKRLLADGQVCRATFFCTKTGHFISKSSFIRQVYTPLLKRAGVPYRKFHTFRHTHVSQLLARVSRSWTSPPGRRPSRGHPQDLRATSCRATPSDSRPASTPCTADR